MKAQWLRRLSGLLVFLILIAVGCAPSEPVAFRVDGVAVEKAELIYHMKRNADIVAAELEDSHGLDSFQEGFWTTEQNGVNPFEYLKTYAENKIVRTKIEQLYAAEYGIKTPLSYTEQLVERKRQNDERWDAQQKGEVVYGTVLRDFPTYFSEMYLKMKSELIEKLVEEQKLVIGEGQVKQYYQDNQSKFTGTYEENRDAIYTLLVEESYEDRIDERVAAAKITYEDIAVEPADVV